MIHIIFGAPGTGKSSKQTHFAKELCQNNGRALLANCKRQVDVARAEGYELSYPDRVPIFSDFPMRFKIGYEKVYETYFINGYYLGLPNDKLPVMPIPPGAVIFLSEAQRYYYSRKSSTFPDWVSRFYEMHRHFGLEIYMDVQRPILIDPNIRELSQHFIEIHNLEHETNFAGKITCSTWSCREWDTWKNVDAYLNTGVENYKETTYTNRGDIFDNFDSFTYFDNFIPTGGDFNYLPHLSQQDAEKTIYREFYRLVEPTAYRGKKQ